MTAATFQNFEASIAQLTDLQNLRVWSIIVSLFGDLAQKTGDQISGTTLTQIITPMGIKPEAIRVALHRLRKEVLHLRCACVQAMFCIGRLGQADAVGQ